VVPGTDSGGSFVIPGSGLHQELALLLRAGLTPFEALRAATSNAATVLGLGDRKGSVEIGKDADLILVDGDPLQDLGCVRAPVGMVLRGRWIGGEELARLRTRTFNDAHLEQESAAATP
jgi:imidazolonepropionase-like amidohydrolase